MSTLSKLFSRSEWMVRLLKLAEVKEGTSRQGLVMVQIDGLSYDEFLRALKAGRMPFTAKLLKNEGYNTHRHYTGLPSNTPAVQGTLFYGCRGCVPAFSFKDRDTGKIFNMFNPESAQIMEAALKTNAECLLEGGSAYGNIFTGGAAEPHFCVSSTGWGSFFKAVSPLGIPLSIVFNSHIFIRGLFNALLEVILALHDFFKSILSGKNFMEELSFIPLRVAVCVLLRDIIVAGAKIDIARGLPAIHLNLAGYDEQAHHRGPSSAFAHWSLRGIDNAIRDVWKAAHRSRLRDYSIFVYSDHGQENTIPYLHEHKRTVQEAVAEVFKEKMEADKWEMQFSHGHRHWRAHLLSSKAYSKMDPVGENARIVVTALGAVGHIYPPIDLSFAEKEILAQKLIDDAKIPAVLIASSPGKLVVRNANGRFIFPDEADKLLDPKHPFLKETSQDLVELCHHRNAGAFVILGSRPGMKTITFHTESGSHAGPEIHETSGFAVLPRGALARDMANKPITTLDLREAALRAQERGYPLDHSPSVYLEGHPASLRVMTYNVHKCKGRDGKTSPERIARTVAQYHPDVAGFQEITEDQLKLIAERLSMNYQFYNGNGIVSKYPLRLVRASSLPKHIHGWIFGDRSALWVEVNYHGKKLQFLNTHLGLSGAEGIQQAKALLGVDWMGHEAWTGPVILCGDLNASSKSKICSQLGAAMKNSQFELDEHRPLKTLPSFYPLRLIDHVFVGPGIKTKKVEVPRTHREKLSSDHLPLIVDVEF